MNIGVHEFEKKGEQRVIVNVDLYVPLTDNTPSRDDLSEVVDYDFMRQTIADIIAPGHIQLQETLCDEIMKRMAPGHIQLQETLCDEIMKRMLAHPLVRAARVSTAKPDVYADCAAVGVESFQLKKE